MDELGWTALYFNQDMMVPDMWQLIAYGESFRFTLKSFDGSEVMGQYVYGFGDEAEEGRRLVAATRNCKDSCDAENKAFDWRVIEFWPDYILLYIEFEDPDWVSSNGGRDRL